MSSIVFTSRGALVALVAAMGLQAAGAGTPPVAPGAVQVAGFGTPVTPDALESQRGGFEVVKNDMMLNGTVADNSASDIRTGANFVGQGSFINASGIPTVIQNSGANVLIQNATIINIQYQ